MTYYTFKRSGEFSKLDIKDAPTNWSEQQKDLYSRLPFYVWYSCKLRNIKTKTIPQDILSKATQYTSIDKYLNECFDKWLLKARH